MTRGVGVVAINSNDYEEYPEDSPAKMKEEIAARGYTFPYLVDQSQEIDKAYHAACTPGFYLFDDDLNLVGLSRPDGCQPAGQQRTRHRQGPPPGDGRRSGRQASGKRPAAEHWLQYLMAAGDRTAVFRAVSRGGVTGNVAGVPSR
jgi:hypothetical protein